MAFPWIFASNFEAGTNAEWDSETDTGSKLSFPHYSALSCRADLTVGPYRGAYCAMVDLTTGDTNDHTLTEGDIDIADAATRYFRFYLYVSSSFTGTADDTFNIFELQQAGGTIEMSLSMRITAATNLLEIGFGDSTVAANFVTYPARGRWACIELLATVSTGGAGVATLFLDGTQIQTETSSTQAAAVGQGVLGTQNTLSTTTGVILFDQFIMDDLRVYPIKDRFPDDLLITQNQHIFVGEGYIENASLLSGAGTDCVLTLFDTDTADTTDASNIRLELKNVTNNDIVDPAGVPCHFKRGCYAVLSGTTPSSRAMLKIGRAQGYRSDGAIRNLGARRQP